MRGESCNSPRLAGLFFDGEFSRRSDAGELDNHLAVLCPGVMGRLGRLGIERSGRIGFHLALIPGVARAEIKRAGEDDHRARLVGMPMRLVFPSRRETDARDV